MQLSLQARALFRQSGRAARPLQVPTSRQPAAIVDQWPAATHNRRDRRCVRCLMPLGRASAQRGARRRRRARSRRHDDTTARGSAKAGRPARTRNDQRGAPSVVRAASWLAAAATACKATGPAPGIPQLRARSRASCSVAGDGQASLVPLSATRARPPHWWDLLGSGAALCSLHSNVLPQ